MANYGALQRWLKEMNYPHQPLTRMDFNSLSKGSMGSILGWVSENICTAERMELIKGNIQLAEARKGLGLDVHEKLCAQRAVLRQQEDELQKTIYSLNFEINSLSEKLHAKGFFNDIFSISFNILYRRREATCRC
jgi:hypothetical protein